MTQSAGRSTKTNYRNEPKALITNCMSYAHDFNHSPVHTNSISLSASRCGDLNLERNSI